MTETIGARDTGNTSRNATVTCATATDLAIAVIGALATEHLGLQTIQNEWLNLENHD